MGYELELEKFYTRKINTIKFIFNLQCTWMEYCEKIDMHDMQTIRTKKYSY